MNAYHKLVLLLFYTIFALIIIFKSNELTKMSSDYTILLFVAVFVLTILTVLKNKKYIEKFEDDGTTTGTTTTSSSQIRINNPAGSNVLSINDIDRNIIVNEKHQDLLLSGSQLPINYVSFYYSCFQYDSIDFLQKKWSSVVNKNDKLYIKTVDNLFSRYKQKDGFNLSENVMIEGTNSDSLKMSSYRMKQFTFFMYVKLNIKTNDFNTYNLYELYSSNVEGNIAFCVKIENKKLKIVYGGIEFGDTIAMNNYLNTEEPILLTIVKHQQDNSHHIKIYVHKNVGDVNDVNDVNNLNFTIADIDYDSIKYISGNRSYIELSKEKFTINKFLDQTHGGLNMKLLNIGMINTPLSADAIKGIYDHLVDQRVNQLNASVIESNTQLALQRETINNLEAELDRLNQCKLSPEVCGQCVGVDTSRFSAIQNDTKCYSAFRNKCELIKKDPMYVNNSEEEEFCRFMSPVVIQTASNCVADNSQESKNIRTISLDRVSREDSGTPNADQLDDIKLHDLYKPIEKTEEEVVEEEEKTCPEKKEEKKDTSDKKTIKDFVDGKVSKDQLYKNIMDDYQKDLNSKIDEIDSEDSSEEKSSSFLDFMKYFFFMK